MTKKSILELPIDIYTPDDPELPYIAFIRGLPMVFKAPSKLRVKRAAEDWRTEEVEKEAKAKAAREARRAGLQKYREEKAAEVPT